MNDDPELILRAGTWEARVAPCGAGLRGLTKEGLPVATGYTGIENKLGSQGDLLVPFPGRIGGARYTWDGTEHTLEANDKDGPNAIHGFLRTAPFQVTEQSETGATFTCDFAGAEGYPFPLSVVLRYELSESGLACTLKLTNTGTVACPVAGGFHPYFTVGSALVDADTLTVPFQEVLEMVQFVPTGKIFSVAEAGVDFRQPRTLGPQVLNHCFLSPIRDADGLCRVSLAGNGRTVTVWMDGAFNYVVLYTGENMPPEERRASLAIEPMSCGSDAFNHPEWGLTRLEPGQSTQGTWGVTAG